MRIPDFASSIAVPNKMNIDPPIPHPIPYKIADDNPTDRVGGILSESFSFKIDTTFNIKFEIYSLNKTLTIFLSERYLRLLLNRHLLIIITPLHNYSCLLDL